MTIPIWKFSDETTVGLGGAIEGGSLFAQSLRQDVADGVLISFDPPPSRGVDLDVNSLLHMDFWLRQEMQRPRYAHMKLKLVESPENVPPVPVSDQGEPPTVPDGFDPIY